MSNEGLAAGLFLKALLGVVAAVLLFAAGHDMRTADGAFSHAMGLFAYGLAVGALMAAVPINYVGTQRELPREIALAERDIRYEEGLTKPD